MSFSLPERVTLKGPNFIREVFERGVGVEGFISFGIGNNLYLYYYYSRRIC